MILKKIKHVEHEDVHGWDAPDFCDAYVSYAEYDGEEMTESQLDELNDNSELVHELLIEHN